MCTCTCDGVLVLQALAMSSEILHVRYTWYACAYNYNVDVGVVTPSGVAKHLSHILNEYSVSWMHKKSWMKIAHLEWIYLHKKSCMKIAHLEWILYTSWMKLRVLNEYCMHLEWKCNIWILKQTAHHIRGCDHTRMCIMYTCKRTCMYTIIQKLLLSLRHHSIIFIRHTYLWVCGFIASCGCFN